MTDSKICVMYGSLTFWSFQVLRCLVATIRLQTTPSRTMPATGKTTRSSPTQVITRPHIAPTMIGETTSITAPRENETWETPVIHVTMLDSLAVGAAIEGSPGHQRGRRLTDTEVGGSITVTMID